ncbi:MAG TPA: DUF1573 domain-containing protein, partial [Chryseosolibacter sp.]|nr:DUF1573 domain-containing protein [Chryseosolibacter sp.]
GPVTHEFVFTNNASRPLTILSVQPSCGCTTPGWSKEPIPAGGSGYVTASFDPKGRPGSFHKTLTVNTDLEGGQVILSIKGQVAADEPDHVDETGFIVSYGSLKMKNRSLNIGKAFLKDEYVVKEFPVINAGSKPITFEQKVIAPKHIRVEVNPSTLEPGAKGVIRVNYNGKLKNQYGFHSDNIELHTNDEIDPVKSISVLATLEDFFPVMTTDELEKSPQLRLSSTSLDFGRINGNTKIIREVEFTNAGKKPLEIRSVQGNCSCVQASSSKKSVKPGEKASITVTFDPQDRKGSHQKAVTVYSNDPRNPVQRFTFMTYIE